MARQPPADICSYAVAAQKLYRVPASVQLAQWILESGWGVHSPGNNPFGMKPRKGMNDPFFNLSTTEHLNGKDVTVVQPFRTFPSVSAAFDAHARLLATAPVYAPAMAALPNRDRFIDLMADGGDGPGGRPGYATAPNYAQQVKGLIKSQGLDKYDEA